MFKLNNVSILKGPQYKCKSNFLHRIFEDNVRAGCGMKNAIIYNGNPC